MVLSLFGCSNEKEAEMNIMVLKGPTGMGMTYLMDQSAKDPETLYQFSVAATPDEVVAQVANGSVDVAAVPTNLAAVLYQRTNQSVQMLAIETYGSLYILTDDASVTAWEDLRGKTVYATGQGANPEYILNYLLTKNGLIPGQDVKIEFKSEHAELATLMASGSVTLGMLPEPNVTSAMMQNDKLRIAFNLNDEWDKVAPGGLAMGCLIVNKQFAEEHPKQLKKFLDQTEESVDYVVANPAEAGVLCETYGIIPKAAIATKAIPNCNLTFVKGNEMKTTIEGYFQVLLEANPQSIGGSLPDEAFYYNK